MTGLKNVSRKMTILLLCVVLMTFMAVPAFAYGPSLSPAKITSVEASAASLTVTIGKVKKADGYQVRYSTSKSMKHAKTLTGKNRTKTINGLTSGKTYYVQVRAYDRHKFYTVWSKWSKKASEKTSEETEIKIEQSTSGWTIAESFGNADIPESKLEMFNSAMEGYTGVSYTPICYLGSQVVSGINNYYLCKAKVIAPDTSTTLKIVCIYKDLDNQLEVKSIEDFNLASYAKDNAIDSAVGGSVTAYTETAEGTLPASVKTAFDNAVQNVNDITYTPLCYLGSRVISGANYSILCLGTSEEETHIYVLTILSQPWSKTYKITSVYGLY